MQSYSTISEMYTYYYCTRDPGQATEAVSLLWKQKTDALKALPEAEQQRKIDKLLALADAQPSPRFGQLVRSIASGAGAPATVDASGILRPSRMSPVLLSETPMNSLTRIFDPVGRVADILLDTFKQPGSLALRAGERQAGIAPAVAVRVHQRVSRSLLASGLQEQFEATLRKLNSESGVSVDALWRAVDWMELPTRLLALTRLVNILADKANGWVAQQLPTPPGLDQRTSNDVRAARLLLKTLVGTAPMAFPVLSDHPGLEDFLAIALHGEEAEVERALEASEMHKKLTLLYKTFQQYGYAAIDAVPWNATDPIERQAAIAYCCTIAFMDSFADGVAPQMRQVVDEETQARWSHRLARHPQDVSALRGRAEAFLAQGKPAAALQDMAAAVELQPDAANLMGYAKLLQQAGKLSEADAALTRALASVGEDADSQAQLYTARAGLRLELKQPLFAWGDAVRGVRGAPDDAEALKMHKAAYEAARNAWYDQRLALRRDLSPEDYAAFTEGKDSVMQLQWAEADTIFAGLQRRLPGEPRVQPWCTFIASQRAPGSAAPQPSEADAQGRLARDLRVAPPAQREAAA